MSNKKQNSLTRAKHVELLKQKLSHCFPVNKFRIDFMALFIIALIQICTINLSHLAAAFPGDTKVASHYKRLQRFFRLFEFDEPIVAKLIISLLPLKKFILSMDRTNWKFGKVDINILVIGIVYKGICFPIVWKFLAKRGNSNTDERTELINKCLDFIGLNNIECLLADREFIGERWFGYLLAKRIPFNIRIKDNFLLSNGQPVKSLFREVKPQEEKTFKKRYAICGHKLYLSGTRIKGEYLIVVTPDKPVEALAMYAKRWEIETLFGCLKTRGFNFEDTHLTSHERINTLLVMLTISFCWAHLIGEWLHEQIPIEIKKHGRMVKSIFRYGLDYLKNILFNISEKFNLFVQVLKLLSCT
jgi:hypothetical protein